MLKQKFSSRPLAPSFDVFPVCLHLCPGRRSFQTCLSGSTTLVSNTPPPATIMFLSHSLSVLASLSLSASCPCVELSDLPSCAVNLVHEQWCPRAGNVGFAGVPVNILCVLGPGQQ